MGKAISGVFFGIFLFIAAIILVGWNEGRNVNTLCAIYEGQDLIKEASCNYDPANDGQLVHITCPITANTSSSTFEFAPLEIKETGAKFSMSLEQYIYIESQSCRTKKNSVGGGSTKTCTYTYSLKWSSSAETYRNNNLVEKARYSNPAFPSALQNQLTAAGRETNGVYLGNGYKVTSDSRTEFYETEFAVTSPIRRTFKDRAVAVSAIITTGTNTSNGTINFQKAGSYYVSYPGSPRIGDVRISARVAPIASVGSVSAKQNAGGEFTKFKFEKCSGYSYHEYSKGSKTAEDLAQEAKDSNALLTWVLRIFCFFAIWCGLQMCVGPIALIPDLIPFIGPYIGDLVGCLLCCATCLCATFWWCFVFAISWLVFRPIIGVPLLCVALLTMTALIVWRVRAYQRGAQSDAEIKEHKALEAAAPAAAPPAAIAMATQPAQAYNPAVQGYPAAGYPTQTAPGGYPAAQSYPAQAAPGGYPAAGGYAAPPAYATPGGAYPAPGGGAYPAPGGTSYPAPGAPY